MPIYEYSCEACQSDCELLVRNDERPACPSCGSDRLFKLLSVPAAPGRSANELPVCGPSPGPCGRPECGGGGCAF